MSFSPPLGASVSATRQKPRRGRIRDDTPRAAFLEFSARKPLFLELLRCQRMPLSIENCVWA
jgi:hypothetical protein